MRDALHFGDEIVVQGKVLQIGQTLQMLDFADFILN